MKKIIFTTAFAFAALYTSAQIKVFTNGKVAAGDTTTPYQSLDVTGDISLVSATNSFRINNNIILGHKGITTGIFLGLGAGGSTTGANNTFIGNDAGKINTTGSSNVFMGYRAGYSNTTAVGIIAIGFSAGYSNASNYGNIAIGYEALYSSTGAANIGIGTYALKNTTSGSNSVAVGFHGLMYNTTGTDNTGTGHYSLEQNTTGSYNAAFGRHALSKNTSGSNNTGCGVNAIYNNTTGYNNTSCGYSTLVVNSTGYNNTAIGNSALSNNTTGYNNTALGYCADVGNANLNNATAIGYNSSATANDMMYLGNANTVIYCASGQITGSDGRFKTNVTESVKGLEFINKLRPVTYNMNTNILDDFLIQNLSDSLKTFHKEGMDFAASTAVVHSGFIAQEVEQAALQTGFTSSIVHAPDNEGTHYGLNYAEIVVPLVKAVQELSKMTDTLTTVITKQDSTINAQNFKIDELQNQITNCCSVTPQGMGLINNGNNYNSIENKNGNVLNETASNTTATLFQNVPNPFNQHTNIEYFIPANAQSASIMVFDLNGKLINTFPIRAFGKDAITINGSQLNPGMFVYSLIVDEKIIDTKRMILTH